MFEKISAVSKNSAVAAAVAERKRQGREGYYEHASKKFLPQTIYIVSVMFMAT